MSTTAEIYLIVIGVITATVFALILIFIGDLIYGYLLWLFIAIFLGRQFFFISIPGFPDIYLERIMFAVLFGIFLIEIMRGRESTLPNTPVEFFMGVLILVLIASMWRTGFVATFGDEYQPFHIFLTGFLFPFSFYYFSKTVIYSERRVKILFGAFFVLLLYLVITAVLEHFNFKTLVIPQYIMNPLEGIHYGRSRGPFVNAPVNGWVIATLFFITLFLRSQLRESLGKFIVFWPLILTPVALFYTYTRAVWLSFILAPLVAMLFSKKLLLRARFFVFPMAIFILVVFVNWENIMSRERAAGGVMQISEVEARIALYQATKAAFKDVPFFGVGFGRFGRYAPVYFPEAAVGTSAQYASQHNIFFGLLSEVGLLGLVPFLLVLYFPLRYSIKLYKELGEEGFFNRDLVVAFWGVLIVYVVSASFIQTQFFLTANAMVFSFMGIIVGLYQRRLIPE
jgi:O-antigen ligase